MTEPWSWRHIRVFEAVARLGSFTKAAAHLEMTQPAVSKVVKQLENAWQLALFDPTDRRHLTPAGHMLLQHARSIQAQVLAAQQACDGLVEALASTHGTKGPSGLLHVAVVSPAHYFVPAILHAFQTLCPHAMLRLSLAKRSDILEGLQNRQFEIAITGYPPSDAELEAHQFARHPHVLVASPGHPLARQIGLQWADLQRAEVIWRERGSSTRLFLEQLLQAKQVQVHQNLEMGSNEAVKQAVMCGMGISFMSAHACQTEIKAGLLAVLPLEDMPKQIDWCVIHRRGIEPSGIVQAFKDFVLNKGSAFCECHMHPDALPVS
mgnify:FL=1